jgi:hypothetical protein
MQAEMKIQIEETEAQVAEVAARPRWRLAKRIAFRFTFAYLVLYSFPFPVQYIPYAGDYISEKYTIIWNAIVPWVGKHLLRLSYEVPIAFTGSGDRTYDWIQSLCFLALAAIATLVWSLIDRRRIHYEKLYQWFRLYIRFSLASWMIIYGTIKAIPVQMPVPAYWRLLEPYGDSSPMGLLWTFMGASPVYTSITGCIELLGGVLLILPRTTTLGALVSFAAMTQVFLLNMCYDVPVKLFSFHLVLMPVFILAPDLRRIANTLVLNRRVEPVEVRPLFKRKRLNRGALAFQILFGLYLLGWNLNSAYDGYKTYGGGAPKPPLHGIWAVEEYKVDGEVKPPLITDETRWQRALFERAGSMIVQPMKGGRQFFRLQLDLDNKSLSLGKGDDPNWKADFTFVEPEPGRMSLTGELDGRRTEIKLLREDASQFLLLSRGFHWVQERPFNR